ncbi:MAG: UbiD family decarboxylase, partial [Candidatus Nitrosopolaris sp.]
MREPTTNKIEISENNIDLRNFLSLLEKENELIIIKKSIDPKFEIAAIVSKMGGGQAILFETVKDSRIRVACNILGNRGRFFLAIGAKKEKLIHSYVTEAMTRTIEPKKIFAKAPFEENSSNNLRDLPIVTHFEKDAGAYITSSIVFAKDEEMGNQNASTHRLLLLDDRHLAIRMVEGRHLHKCFSFAKEHGQDLKASIAIGVHPAISIASAYQAAYSTNEMLIANSLLHEKLTVTWSNYSHLFIPTLSEIVLEGRILRDRTEDEWMVEALRTYDLKRRQPVLELDRIKFRNNAIYHDILPGFPEHRLLMGLPMEAKVFEGVKNVVPTAMTVRLTEG